MVLFRDNRLILESSLETERKWKGIEEDERKEPIKVQN